MLDAIENIEQLEEMLSEPTDKVVETFRNLPGDFILLGIGGKMGPTLARMILRAAEKSNTPRKVIGVSRFSNAETRQELEDFGIETIAGDLLDRDFVQSLPDVPNVISMSGMKFGATGNEPQIWAMNAYLPVLLCEKFQSSRIVAFSTGNVYPLVPVESGGCVETDMMQPNGEYAMSVLGRERMYDYCCQKHEIPMALIRLNYAVETRYGVIVDLATKIKHQQPIDVSMGHVNVIWQADANAMTLCAFADLSTPPFIVNVAGPEILRVRDIAEQLGKTMEIEPILIGEEATDALLNNGTMGHQRYGSPRFSAHQIIDWVGEWVTNDKPLLGKPTHFESRSGKY